eukprot:TRINITY_DN8643_c0_g4_i1.p1 TRINITY_DN8643_c0_g4~~TRINITY_DN8643_c0_g4_i1.p1  ORF type:complete len:513 (-),score=101.08 TRINITY_DN8643_c0_g4_i1:192-1730(-)
MPGSWLLSNSRPLSGARRPRTADGKPCLLVIFDMNGVLVLRAGSDRAKGSLRPYLDTLLTTLQDLSDRIKIAVWSSMMVHNLQPLVTLAFGPYADDLLFVWDQSQCTQRHQPGLGKPLLRKDLAQLRQTPWAGYAPEGVLLVDDDPIKCSANIAGTAVHPSKWQGDPSDCELLRLSAYLRAIAESDFDTVPKFVKANPWESFEDMIVPEGMSEPAAKKPRIADEAEDEGEDFWQADPQEEDLQDEETLGTDLGDAAPMTPPMCAPGGKGKDKDKGKGKNKDKGKGNSKGKVNSSAPWRSSAAPPWRSGAAVPWRASEEQDASEEEAAPAEEGDDDDAALAFGEPEVEADEEEDDMPPLLGEPEAEEEAEAEAVDELAAVCPRTPEPEDEPEQPQRAVPRRIVPRAKRGRRGARGEDDLVDMGEFEAAQAEDSSDESSDEPVRNAKARVSAASRYGFEVAQDEEEGDSVEAYYTQTDSWLPATLVEIIAGDGSMRIRWKEDGSQSVLPSSYVR